MRIIQKRTDFPALLRELNLNGAGVEVGVWKGRFSKILLRDSDLSILYSVDTWDESYVKDKWKKNIHLAHDKAKNVLGKFGDRSVVVKDASKNAAQSFENEFFDFIYIDAGHDYESVKLDISSWWPKVRPMGIFAGHDYFHRSTKEWAVVKAVNEFVSENKLQLHITSETAKWKSWYVMKPKSQLNLGWINQDNPKILGIGLTKTGTRSLTSALKILGYKTCHYPWSLEEIDSHDASTDIPISCRFKSLDAMYPGSKFILTTRNFDDWIKTASMKPPDPHKPSLWKLDVRMSMYGVLHYDEAAYTRTWKRHHENVEKHFKNRLDDLLILDLGNEDKWGVICAFLGKDVPKIPYPWDGRNKASHLSHLWGNKSIKIL